MEWNVADRYLDGLDGHVVRRRCHGRARARARNVGRSHAAAHCSGAALERDTLEWRAIAQRRAVDDAHRAGALGG